MKIGEFAEMNCVTTKMLRHYDEIGLLKPAAIDQISGYRFYTEEQSNYLNWIIILKNLDFPLLKIKDLLSGPIDAQKLIKELINKRIEIYSAMNEQIQKKIGIDKLIDLLEKEGFNMSEKIDLLNIQQESVHEIKKNIPNMEMFLDEAENISSLSSKEDTFTVFRLDICHFKQVNDEYGYHIGDKVIVAFYNILQSSIQKHIPNSTIGRAGGDEFIVFARAVKQESEAAAFAIIKDLEAYDFSSIGCGIQLGCYIGGLAGKPKTQNDIREMIELSIEIVTQARKKGRNSIILQEDSL